MMSKKNESKNSSLKNHNEKRKAQDNSNKELKDGK